MRSDDCDALMEAGVVTLTLSCYSGAAPCDYTGPAPRFECARRCECEAECWQKEDHVRYVEITDKRLKKYFDTWKKQSNANVPSNLHTAAMPTKCCAWI